LDGTRTYLILSSSGLQQVNLNGETVKDCRKPQNLVTPPTPLRMIPLPGDLPASVRGLTVDVLVFVNEAGTVDSVALNPPTPDQRFNARLMRVAVLVKFEPADSAGQAVPMWFKWTWRF
jgi:TonB family protein